MVTEGKGKPRTRARTKAVAAKANGRKAAGVKAATPRAIKVLGVEVWPVERLAANPRNYRRHTARQIRELRASLRRWGWRKISISARPSDGLMMTGHGVLEAAKAEGMAEVPVLPYECDDQEAAAWLTADNELSRPALVNDDHSKLAGLLSEINESVGLDGVGWNASELDGLCEGLGLVTGAPSAAPPEETPPDESDKIEEWDPAEIQVRERVLVVLDLPFGERETVRRKLRAALGARVLGVKALVEED